MLSEVYHGFPHSIHFITRLPLPVSHYSLPSSHSMLYDRIINYTTETFSHSVVLPRPHSDRTVYLSQNNSMGTNWTTVDSGFDFQRGPQKYLRSRTIIPTASPDRNLIQLVFGAVYLRGKWQGACSCPLTSPSVEVKNGGARPPLSHTPSWRGAYSVWRRAVLTPVRYRANTKIRR
jgi:hypothetical protein